MYCRPTAKLICFLFLLLLNLSLCSDKSLHHISRLLVRCLLDLLKFLLKDIFYSFITRSNFSLYHKIGYVLAHLFQDQQICLGARSNMNKANELSKIVTKVMLLHWSWANIVTLCQSVTFRFQNFSVSKLFHFFYGFGFGIEKNWYKKKYRIRYRKNLVSKKVSDSVSEKFGIGKSFGFGFVQILGNVTHW